MDFSQKNDKKWTHERKLLLISTRLRYEGEFSANRKKRNTLWEKVLKEIRDDDPTFPFTRDETARCFLNIMVTYKRIKKRNNTSGEATTNWDFFEQLDAVYGTRSSICVSDEMLEQSLETLTDMLTSNDSTVQCEDDVSSNTSTPVGGNKRKRDDVLQFLKNSADKDEAIMAKLLKTEADKLELENAKVEELRKIRELFQSIAANISTTN